MNYFLSHLIDSPFARTIVISDSEYKALAQAKAKEAALAVAEKNIIARSE